LEEVQKEANVLKKARSLRTELALTILISISISLFLAAIPLTLIDYYSMRGELIKRVRSIAQLVGIGSASAIVEGDEETAEALLSTTQEYDEIMAGATYSLRHRKLIAKNRDPFTRISSPEFSTKHARHWFEGGYLVIAEPVTKDGDTVGTIFLVASYSSLTTHLLHYIELAVIILMISAAIAFLMATRWAAHIIAPVTELSKAAATFANTHKPPPPLTLKGPHEIQELVGSLKAMVNSCLMQTQALEAARERAEQANREKDLFLSSVSHELRTPLNAIIGYAELVMDELEEAPAEQLRQDLGSIGTASRQLRAIIDDILDLAKIEAGKIELQMGPVPLIPLLEEISRMVKPLVTERGNHFQLIIEEIPKTLWTDEVKLQQLLMNLLGNAAKFTTNGEVGLKVSRKEQWIEFSVTDTGIGIPSEKISTIFSPFIQVHHEPSMKAGSTGLGLAISKKLAVKLSGDLTAQSVEGVGSTFTLRLPLSQT
jgi:signal transduction histidine kinase